MTHFLAYYSHYHSSYQCHSQHSKRRKSHYRRQLRRLLLRVFRASLAVVALIMTARAYSLRFHARALCNSVGSLLPTPAFSLPFSPPLSPPFSASAPFWPLFSPLCWPLYPATLNARKAWRPQAKDEWRHWLEASFHGFGSCGSIWRLFQPRRRRHQKYLFSTKLHFAYMHHYPLA